VLEWAMEEDAELADRVLGAISPHAYGLGRWPDLPRACDWVLADRLRGPHWAHAVAAVALGAALVGRYDVLGIIDRAREVAQEHDDTRAIDALSVAPAYVGLAVGDLTPAREAVAAATRNGNGGSAFQAVTGLMSVLACLGQLDELTVACELGAQ